MEETTTHGLARCALEKEVADLNLPFRGDDDQQYTRDVCEPLKSPRQRHGGALKIIEAPAKLDSAACVHRGGPSQTFSLHHNEGNVCSDNSKGRLAGSLTAPPLSEPPQPHHKLHHKGKFFSTDLDREEAWERKKEQYLLGKGEDDCGDDEKYDADEGFLDEVCVYGGEDESPCGSDDDGAHHDDNKGSHKHSVEHGEGDLGGVRADEGHVDEGHFNAMHDDGIRKASKGMPSVKMKQFPRLPGKPLMIKSRTKSVTDEDMEELRGSLDLGFRFSYDAPCTLESTLPALELYYAINKSYDVAQCRSLPASPLAGHALVWTNSDGSTSSPSNEAWCISSPGDHPNQVKTRLRHWAQAVACSVKQGYEHE